MTDDKSESGKAGQLGLLRCSPVVDPVQVEEEALAFTFLLVWKDEAVTITKIIELNSFC